MRILLLNPPGGKLYLRDYYCSKVSKADTLYEPTDLLMLSGILKGEHELKVVDAIAGRLGETACLARCAAFRPEAVVFVTGAVSYRSDFAFLRRLKAATGARMIGSGDLFLEGARELLEETDFLDAALLDFTDDSILDLLRGRPECRNIVSKQDGRVRAGPVVRGRGEEFDLPLPEHSLFPLPAYRYPFLRGASFATVLTDYGCPHRCRFCVMPGLGHKLRRLDGVLAELAALRRAGIREVYFNDQTFGADRPRTRELLDRMVAEGLGLGWCCFTRADLVDEDGLRRMKRAGCHTLMFGAESACPEILARQEKGLGTEAVREAIGLCRREGLTAVATFILGLPGETRRSAEETIRFALSCGCDYASFNIAVPRVGTPLRREAVAAGTLPAAAAEMDQSGGRAPLRTDELSPEDISGLRGEAVRRFYGRPGYLARQVLKVSGPHDLRRKVRGLLSILKDVRG